MSSPYSVRISDGNEVFRGEVSILEPVDIVDVHEETHTAELADQLRDIDSNTIAIIPGPGSIDPEILELAGNTAVFNEVSELGRTRLDSKHEVAFGQLIVTSIFGQERAELVAVKPFTTAQYGAKELSLGRYFSGVTGVPHPFTSFIPVGVLRNNDGELAVVTKYEHGVRSLDNDFNNPQLPDESQAIASAIGKCAFLLGTQHVEGILSGDAQTKNMFVSNHEKPFIGDFERMRVFRKLRNGKFDPMDARVKAMSDLLTLGSSIHRARPELFEKLPYLADVIFSMVYIGITSGTRSDTPEEGRLTPREIATIIKDPYAAGLSIVESQ